MWPEKPPSALYLPSHGQAERGGRASVYLVIPPVGVPIGLVRNARASSHATLRWPTQMSGALRGPWGLAPTSTNRWMVGSLLVAYFGSLVACFVASPPAFILGCAVGHAGAAVVKWCRFNVAKYRATAAALYTRQYRVDSTRHGASSLGTGQIPSYSMPSSLPEAATG